MSKIYRLGLNIGSTKAKCVVLDKHNNFVYTNDVCHNTHIVSTVLALLDEIGRKLGNNIILSIKVTGSAGMVISEKADIACIQEVVATSELVYRKYLEARTLIDIGSEGSKMYSFFSDRPPDIRINGNCAGGTGKFIDQMATLLNTPVQQFDLLAQKHDQIYLIASRCSVFAKPDVQNLISRNVSKENIDYSILQIVCIQLFKTLVHGYAVVPKVMLIAGALSFISTLGKAVLKILKLNDEQILKTEHPILLSVWGGVIHLIDHTELSINAFIAKLNSSKKVIANQNVRSNPLFNESLPFDDWINKHKYIEIPRINLTDYQKQNAFLGIASRSTTTKLTLIDEDDGLLSTHYAPNNGHTINALIKGVSQLKQKIAESSKNIFIARTGVTFYGEELLKVACAFDDGLGEVYELNRLHFMVSCLKHTQL
ncbi:MULTISPECIES: BadF/BadG/BcrA/BcrD ATPase family protein [unclassified Gilliamella]|uniref:BadF/BadG/BcrA/BcrD ATPase family protein n=1 Tax=unclassified Gilliamella TaxID=2685620 RepID=UPI00080E8127|nr:BadF/BadG/BcrA/BcrD ATPase family protein [Gilliamella apicola]OCG19317.1 hypothetical protein A9G23_09265 [Gilliamella apicola]OCG22400.1 hypothetical protein A9G22_07470 [Gilliamella apicola]